ncbi:MAG: hypothetical protein NXI32_17870 [bacterium]|nr:hypothetical protein [bacterium]
MDSLPSPTESNGRGPNGRFLSGNRIGKGNPAAKQAQQLRFTLMNSVKPADLEQIIGKLIEKAAAGDVQAAKLIMDRVLGPPLSLDIEERISQLERIAGGQQ